MVITTIVSLYTVRVVLDVLGSVDYGIYNVVGGIVVLFSFLNTAMNGSTQRFLSFAIGRNDDGLCQRTFIMSLNCHALLACGIFLISETLGLWFFCTQMNIPDGRMYAAHWAYQFSVLSFVINVIRVPYNASVVSYEKMSFYAYLSIFEVLANLGIVFSLLIDTDIDHLILYAGLKFLIIVLFLIITIVYCKREFKICCYSFLWDKDLFKKLFGFTSWTMLGAGSVLVTQTGSNILINVYWGVAANAAYGIANQVNSAIYAFVSNFQLAFQPQIVKLYAVSQQDEQVSLVNWASKISYFLLLVIFIPFVLYEDYVLGLWLKDVPPYTVDVCRWMLIYSLIDAVQAPLWMSIYATGKIRTYCFWSSLLAITNLPIAWGLLYAGYSPVCVFIVRVIINFIAASIRIMYIRVAFCFPVKGYIMMIFKRVLPVTLSSLFFSYYVKSFFHDSMPSFLISILILVSMIGSIVYFVGFTPAERKVAVLLVNNSLKGLRI